MQFIGRAIEQVLANDDDVRRAERHHVRRREGWLEPASDDGARARVARRRDGRAGRPG